MLEILKQLAGLLFVMLIIAAVFSWGMNQYEDRRDKEDGEDGWGGYV